MGGVEFLVCVLVVHTHSHGGGLMIRGIGHQSVDDDEWRGKKGYDRR